MVNIQTMFFWDMTYEVHLESM